MRATKLFSEFFESEKAGGIVLVLCTLVSIGLANSALQLPYSNFWNMDMGGHSLAHWINDGLMSIFFLLIGLELEREIYKGELSNIRNTLLPVSAAIGGVAIPALIYYSFNVGTPEQDGFGIPMATDIAFALGVLSLLGNRVPTSLKVFLTALAVIDDLCAIIIIAIFYTKGVVLANLFIALAIWAVLLVLNRMKVHNLIPYLAGGIAMWYFMLQSGVHATITGVLLAFAIPFSNGGKKSPSYILQHVLHKPVAFLILPLFALANTVIIIGPGWLQGLTSNVGKGVIAGLFIGKPTGILLLSYLAVKFKICSLPPDIRWKHILGAGMLAGIGFTMSIFITLLAFNDAGLINDTKFFVLIASVISGGLGLVWLNTTLKNKIVPEEETD
ncbi:MAG TPA: Na+/H+ antiporter NhaA [Ferruginibacter sp.]|nr:Na+/H+ antiporter NhaA [Ferruginibacter sp.]HMP21726.1 Na+/H+ antiporter NhaA [Ferruginibacter sp.]